MKISLFNYENVSRQYPTKCFYSAIKGDFLRIHFMKYHNFTLFSGVANVWISTVSTEFRVIHSDPADIYLLKVNNGNTRARFEICSELTIKTLEQRQWRCSGVFIVNFDHVNAGWVGNSAFPRNSHTRK